MDEISLSEVIALHERREKDETKLFSRSESLNSNVSFSGEFKNSLSSIPLESGNIKELDLQTQKMFYDSFIDDLKKESLDNLE
ncbi:hypothetical protein AYI69_g4403 [Smittium culicis]|uniref:Uncharacterized protein n=1 Tax=Smittium culicis TaxID=133412 RepID=A0A1R1YDZ6_9FUNG|nr:hypothetical protein AYI69_g4403 [Smittium culicis]